MTAKLIAQEEIFITSSRERTAVNFTIVINYQPPLNMNSLKCATLKSTMWILDVYNHISSIKKTLNQAEYPISC